MKRSPIQRTGILRIASHDLAARKNKPLRKSTMKKSKPKMTPIRKSARGENCTLLFPCCNGNSETVVWCHSNSAADGKGMGIKAHDVEGCYGCFACHAFLDGGYANTVWSRKTVDLFFDRARGISQYLLREKGLM